MRRLAAVLVLLLLLSVQGCATVAGTVAGPVTGPLHAAENGLGAPPWFKPLVYPLMVPMGVLIGFTTGVAADVGFVLAGGEYGAAGQPRFADVFDPTAAEWGRYTADVGAQSAPPAAAAR